jgi:hypothetical protein
LRKLLGCTCLLVLICASQAFSENIEDLTVTADKISYSEDGMSLEAVGSVDARTNVLSIKASTLDYDIAQKSIHASNGFTMTDNSGLTFEGDALNYDLNTKSGSTKSISLKYKRAILTGEDAVFDDEKIELTNSSFNTCGLEHPHYHVTSKTTTLYPEQGWVLGYWGFLWIEEVPVLPVPVFLYDLSVQGKEGKSVLKDVMPMPVAGKNDEDGYYETYSIPWIANKKLNGRVHIFNTEYGGLGGGVDGNYIANENNDLYFRVYNDHRYNYYGGLTHRYYFGPSLGAQKTALFNFFNFRNQLLFELDTEITKKERINYEMVSKLPELTLLMNEVPAFWDNFRIGGQVSYGHITEESTGTGSDKGGFETRGYFDIPTDIGFLKVGVDYKQYWYGFGSSWTRLNTDIKLSRSFDNGFDGYLRHLHYINYTGQSPFTYEMYYEIPSDEIGTGLGYNFGPHRFTIDAVYYVPDNVPKDIDYGFSIGMHCYTIDMKYRGIRQEFSIGASLILN